MWVLVLLGLMVAAIVFVISLFIWPDLFIAFRYVGLLPILLASMVIKPVTTAFKQDRIPHSRKFRTVYAFIAMIGLVAGGSIWIVIFIIQSLGESTFWVAMISGGLALLALVISYIVERNGLLLQTISRSHENVKESKMHI